MAFIAANDIRSVIALRLSGYISSSGRIPFSPLHYVPSVPSPSAPFPLGAGTQDTGGCPAAQTAGQEPQTAPVHGDGFRKKEPPAGEEQEETGASRR